MTITGAEILLECLEREGVEVIFGYPGGQVIPIYDKLYDSKIRNILVRHEQGAVHAADGYARSTGKPGVCLATSGPGATNLVTGIATAYMDSVPLIAITGQVPTSLIGCDSFQEADITGITIPITKHNYLVRSIKELPRIIKEAFHIATTGRPGPVLIDLPKDISVDKAKFEYPETISLQGYKPNYIGNIRQIKEAADALHKAKRPVLYVGGGAVTSGADELIKKLAEKMEIPVTTTLMGMTAFPSAHPLNLGMLGMHGTATANFAVCETDLLIAVGARFDDRVTGKIDCFAPKATVIHIDIDPAEIGKNVKAEIPIVGDVKTVLETLLEKTETKQHPEWIVQIAKWKQAYPLTYEKSGLKPQMVIEALNEITKGDAIICTEVGQHQMWTAQYYKFNRSRSLITSGGLGTMGFGFPAAVGAQIGNPDKMVINIAGDGSIQMNIQELGTVVAYNIPVKIIILNNFYLGMVRQWQELFFQRRYSGTILETNPDFVKIAEAYGAKGFRITAGDDLVAKLKEALETPGPVVIDCQIDREENVLPMVPAGCAINKMIGVND
ncbi:MAG TPA: biosynthetic-type acetolactate synthase large subunit [Bacillota bacterium]|nr:biosynthetic-type acetolactate synthase large subunit [Bacillota bacterium]HOL08679.1 biosynthetic-type acetolactate synthase large subunit [Bacillota bacterium]HPO96619.1 biosynthetic-type acetolactate synthase large subunit [Bacillota bacterium]